VGKGWGGEEEKRVEGEGGKEDRWKRGQLVDIIVIQNDKDDGCLYTK
jgi:hypothetical protein